MTSRSGKGKGKKTVETSLGRAPGQSDKQVDLSHVRKPISTSVFGIKQVLSLLKDATAEVQDYITYECDILYECRMCRSIFRSLANFILHKREYCREKCNASREAPGSVKETVSNYVIDEEVIELSDEHSRSVTPETPAHCAAKPAKALSPVIEKLLKKHGVADLERETLNEDLAKQSEYRPEDDHPDQKQDNVVLQKIEANPSAVFQTMVADPGGGGLEDESLTKTEVMELHGMLDDNTVVLSATGKICNLETARYFAKANIPKQEYICTACNSRFSTKKTLKSHLQRKHNKSCLMYLCPDCKESYSTAWGVFRHLSKVHKKTMSQVKRMRNQIHSNAVLKELEPVKKQDKKASDESEETEEDQWIRNIEKDKDFQMCGGCGRRFERKAALHSHSQTCSKRITVCNAIKESKAKMSASKPKTPSKSDKVADATAGLKGAAKRKAGPLQNRLNPDKFGLKKSNV